MKRKDHSTSTADMAGFGLDADSYIARPFQKDKTGRATPYLKQTHDISAVIRAKVQAKANRAAGNIQSMLVGILGHQRIADSMRRILAQPRRIPPPPCAPNWREKHQPR